MKYFKALVAVAVIFFSNSSFADDKVEEKKSDEKKEFTPKWALSYFNFSTSPASYLNYGNSSWNIYQYFNFSYITGPTTRYSIRAAFTIQTPGVFDSTNVPRVMTTYANDLHFAYSDFSLRKWEEQDLNLSGTFYLYLPTTEFSQAKKWVVRATSWMIFEKALNPDLKVSYNLKPELYWLTQKAFRIENSKIQPDGTSITDAYPGANQTAKLDHYVELSYTINNAVAPQIDLGVVHEWYADTQWVDNKPLLVESLKLAPGFFWSVKPSLKFLISAENKINIRDPNKSFQLFREEETTYLILTFWSLN